MGAPSEGVTRYVNLPNFTSFKFVLVGINVSSRASLNKLTHSQAQLV